MSFVGAARATKVSYFVGSFQAEIHHLTSKSLLSLLSFVGPAQAAKLLYFYWKYTNSKNTRPKQVEMNHLTLKSLLLLLSFEERVAVPRKRGWNLGRYYKHYRF